MKRSISIPKGTVYVNVAKRDKSGKWTYQATPRKDFKVSVIRFDGFLRCFDSDRQYLGQVSVHRGMRIDR
jgi:hypothetical protein